MTVGRGAAGLLALTLAVLVGFPAPSAHALYRKPCRFCGPPWFYPEPPIDVPSLPHSFALTVPVGPELQARPLAQRLDRYADVGPALAQCWNPAIDFNGSAWHAVTIRIAFRRDGSIFGLPRIPFADADSQEARASLTGSLLAALKTCTPLSFSPGLGAAIAGEIFAIRFTHQDER